MKVAAAGNFRFPVSDDLLGDFLFGKSAAYPCRRNPFSGYPKTCVCLAQESTSSRKASVKT
jgi:hypothetical protein